jgi:predicted transcriptional regulator
MNLNDVKEILNAEVLVGPNNPMMEIKMGCGCDLMSDVLAFTKAESLLLTGLTNSQVVRTAEMADISAVCFTRGKKPGEETIKLAKSKGLPLLTTKLPMFESCGLLYANGVVGCSEYEG